MLRSRSKAKSGLYPDKLQKDELTRFEIPDVRLSKALTLASIVDAHLSFFI